MRTTHPRLMSLISEHEHVECKCELYLMPAARHTVSSFEYTHRDTCYQNDSCLTVIILTNM